MSDRALEIGIPKRDLKRALVLMRDVQITAVREGLDARAFRVALLFGLKCDTHFCKQRLSESDMKVLEEIAESYYQMVKK